MTKQEAINAMKSGAKVTHDFFTPEEWVTMEDGLIKTEDGYSMSEVSFWRYRKSNLFGSGWSLWEDVNV